MSTNKVWYHAGAPCNGCAGIGEMWRRLDAAGVGFGVYSVEGGGLIAEASQFARADPLVYRTLATDVAAYDLPPEQAAARSWALLMEKLPPEVKALKDRVWIEIGNEQDKGRADWLGWYYVALAGHAAAEGYRMVERSLKHSVLVLTLVFAAFFLFETLAGLKLHAVHYGLVGAALCLFYLALLALGEVLPPGQAYVGAAVASSGLIGGYSISVLRSYARAGTIAALLAAEHSVLYVVLRMEDYALLAGTASLFVVLAGIMFFTRNVDWFAQEAGKARTT